MNNEIWKDIPNFSGYMISNLGRVKSLDRKIIDKLERTQNIKGKIKSICLNGNGYPYVGLQLLGKKSRPYVHRLVAESFVLGQAKNLQVNHMDGDKTNNIATNLEWVTQRANIQHANSLGLNTKLSEVEVRQIKLLLQDTTCTLKEIGDEYNVTANNISAIKRGISWKHVKI